MKIPDTPRIKIKNWESVLENLAKVGIRVELTDPKRFPALKLRYKWIKRNSIPLTAILHSQAINSIIAFKSGMGFGFTRVVLPNFINPKLAYFLGCLRDGSLIISSRKFWIRVYDTLKNTWLENMVIPIFRDLFKITPTLRDNPSNNTKYLDISCKPLCLYLKSLTGNLHGDVPELIKRSSKTIQSFYIRGFFDAEGYVFPIDVKDFIEFEIRISQKNKKSLEFIQMFLMNNGIQCSISGHQLLIFNKDNIEKFYKLVGSSNPIKLKRLNMLLGIST
jgi:hypothetical protein